ncbi:MAG: hypothetical protein EZS28_054295, partial [Streblomastix strix]
MKCVDNVLTPPSEEELKKLGVQQAGSIQTTQKNQDQEGQSNTKQLNKVGSTQNLIEQQQAQQAQQQQEAEQEEQEEDGLFYLEDDVVQEEKRFITSWMKGVDEEAELEKKKIKDSKDAAVNALIRLKEEQLEQEAQFDSQQGKQDDLKGKDSLMSQMGKKDQLLQGTDKQDKLKQQKKLKEKEKEKDKHLIKEERLKDQNVE